MLNPIVRLLLPLSVISILVIYFQVWILWGVSYFQWALHFYIAKLASYIPIPGALLLASVIVLTSLVILPVMVFDIWHKRHYFERSKHIVIISMILWLVFAMVLTAPY